MFINFLENISVASISCDIDVDPKLFLDCETEDDLRYSVKTYYYDNPFDAYSLGDVSVEESDVEFELPDEFIEEWKKLKADENSK